MNIKNGDQQMSDGFTAQDVLTFGTMNNLGRNSGYGPAWGGGDHYGLPGGSWANPGANAVRLNRNADVSKTENECNRTLFGQAFGSIQNSFENATRAGEFQQVCNKLGEVDTRNTDGQFRSEIRASDIARQVASDAKLDKLLECCCDQKVEAAKAETRNVERYCELKAGQATIVATLAANKEIGEKNDEIWALRTQIQCGCHCDSHGHHGRG